MKEMIGYRIVEIKNGKVLSLFHATNGSRVLPFNVWIRANHKQVRDGSSSFTYKSGFHFFPDKESAEEFFDRRFRIKQNRKVVPCRVRGNIRIKNNNVIPTCLLADEIMFIDKEVLE